MPLVATGSRLGTETLEAMIYNEVYLTWDFRSPDTEFHPDSHAQRKAHSRRNARL